MLSRTELRQRALALLNARRHRLAFGVFATVVALYTAILVVGQRSSRDGVHVQTWSSEEMMQAQPAALLRDRPFAALFYLHKQPPMLDAIRAVIAQLYGGDDLAGLHLFVDVWLYRLWILLAAALAALVFVWLDKLTSRAVALVVTAVWVLHPSPLYYATFLDTTLLSCCLTTWMFYELGRLKRGERHALLRLCISVVLVVYTRTVFQWYFIIILPVLLLIGGIPAGVVARGAAIIALLAGPLFIKQALVFHTTATTTFGGEHYCGVMWKRPTPDELRAAEARIEHTYPDAARPLQSKFNDEPSWRGHHALSAVCREHARNHPGEALAGIAKSLAQNLPVFIRASFRYRSHELMKLIPYLGLYEYTLAGIAWCVLLAIALLLRLLTGGPLRRQMREDAPEGVLASYVILTTLLANRYGWTESERLKFIIEPVLLIFIVVNLRAGVRWWRARRAAQNSVT